MSYDDITPGVMSDRSPEAAAAAPGRAAPVTPAQAARDAFWVLYPGTGPIPEAVWEATAQAVLNQAFPGLRAEIADLKRQRDDYRSRLRATDESWTSLAAERDALRAERDSLTGRAEYAERELNKSIDETALLRHLVGEILGALGPRPNGISNPQIAKWRARAGLEG